MKAITKYRMIIVYVVLFSLNALFTTVLAALQGSEWPSLTGTMKFCIVIAVGANWTGMLLAFFNRSWAQLEKGEVPLQNTVAPPSQTP